MDSETADRLFALHTDLMMVIGRMKRFGPAIDLNSVHPATEFAILDTILRSGCRNVPAIAKSRGVTRQSVQKVVNKLIDAQTLVYVENPRHRSSNWLEITARGQQIYQRVRSSIVERYLPVEADLRQSDIESAARVIALIANTWNPVEEIQT
jgi:DNA-binding MarR family transcriptional regulator